MRNYPIQAENKHYLAGILSVPSAYSWESDINSKGNVLNLCQFNVGYADAESNIEQAVIDKTCENTNHSIHFIPQGGSVLMD